MGIKSWFEFTDPVKREQWVFTNILFYAMYIYKQKAWAAYDWAKSPYENAVSLHLLLVIKVD
jgi:hypothetical protein